VSQKYGVNPTPHNQQLYWNPENRLDSLRYDGYYTVTYKYNALGQPVLKYRNGTLDRAWLWDGDALLAEFNSSNQRVAEYLYNGIDHPYAAVTGATTASGIQYHEQDELGNVLGTHTGTSVTESISYDPWGMPTYSGTIDSRLMWKGLMWEGGPSTGDVVGLYYVRGRWYDPQPGRFIQEDPIGVDGGVNVYLYAGDDPVNGSDPSGMDPDPGDICKIFGFDYVSFTNGNGGCVVPGGDEPYQEPAIPVTAPADPPSTPSDPPWTHTDDPGSQQPSQPPSAKPLTPAQKGMVVKAIQNLYRRGECSELANTAAKYFPNQMYSVPSLGGQLGYWTAGEYDSVHQAIVFASRAFSNRLLLQNTIAHEAAHTLITLSPLADEMHNNPNSGPYFRSDPIYSWADKCTY